MWTKNKNCYELLKFSNNVDTFITYHNVLLEVYFVHAYTHTHTHTHTHTQNAIIMVFFWNFGIVPATHFIPLFPLAYKTHCIYPSCYHQTRPWVDINTLNTFYSWLFSLAPCRNVSEQFCLRLWVIRRSVAIIITWNLIVIY